MTIKEKRIAFWQLLIDTEGNFSVSDLTKLGFTEGWAVETIIKMSQFSPTQVKKMIEKAKEAIAKEKENES